MDAPVGTSRRAPRHGGAHRRAIAIAAVAGMVLVGIIVAVVLMLRRKKPAGGGGGNKQPTGGGGSLLGSNVRFALGATSDTAFGLKLGPNGLSVTASPGEGSAWSWVAAQNIGDIASAPVTDAAHKWIVAGSLTATTAKGTQVYLSTDGKVLTTTTTPGESFVFFAGTSKDATTYGMGIGQSASGKPVGWVVEPTAAGPVSVSLAVNAFVTIAGAPPPSLPPVAAPFLPNMAYSKPPSLPLTIFAGPVQNIKLVGSTTSVQVTGATSGAQLAGASVVGATGCWVWTPLPYDDSWAVPADMPSAASVQAGTLANLSNGGATLYLTGPPAADVGKPATLSPTPVPVLLVSPRGSTAVTVFNVAFTAPAGTASPGWLAASASENRFVTSDSFADAYSVQAISIAMNTSLFIKASAGTTMYGGRIVSISDLQVGAPASLPDVQLRAVSDDGSVVAALGALATLTPSTRGSNRVRDSFSIDKLVIPVIDVGAIVGGGGYAKPNATAIMRLDAAFAQPVKVGPSNSTPITAGPGNTATFIFITAMGGTTGYLGLCQPQAAFAAGAAPPPMGWLAYNAKDGFFLSKTNSGAAMMAIATSSAQLLNVAAPGAITSYTPALGAGAPNGGNGSKGCIPVKVLAGNAVSEVVPRVQCNHVFDLSDWGMPSTPGGAFTMGSASHSRPYYGSSGPWAWTPLSLAEAQKFAAENVLPPTPTTSTGFGMILGTLTYNSKWYLGLAAPPAGSALSYGPGLVDRYTVVALFVVQSGAGFTSGPPGSQIPPESVMQIGFPVQPKSALEVPAIMGGLAGSAGRYVPQIAEYHGGAFTTGWFTTNITLGCALFAPGKAPGFVTDIAAAAGPETRPSGSAVPLSRLASALGPLTLTA